MGQKTDNQKGDHIWVKDYLQSTPARLRPAIVLAVVPQCQPWENEYHLAVRYEDSKSLNNSYECISQSRIAGLREINNISEQ